MTCAPCYRRDVASLIVYITKDKCDKDITKDNISGRLRTFDKYFKVISKILSESGFGWDWINNKPSIYSGDVWDKYVGVTTKSTHP